MEFVNTLLLLLLLLITATTVAAYVVIYNRRRRQKQIASNEGRRKAAEEEQRREVEQEAARRSEEGERQRAEAERRGFEEELQRAEDELRRTEEERKRLEEEANHEADQAGWKTQEKHRKSEELHEVEEEPRRKKEAQQKAHQKKRLKAETKSKRVEPGKRGGRPRDSIPDLQKQLVQETKSRRPKTEIVCWKRGRQWILAVEVPEDLLAKSGLAVLQDRSPLPQDESREAYWRLERAFGEVVVRWNEGEDVQETKVALGQEGYLLFKLSGQDQNQGRRVKSPSSGSYLVMVLDNWKRDDMLSGPPPVTPESIFLTGYQAHFFELGKDGDGKIAFRNPAGEPFVIESKTPLFELVGNRLNDASENIGPLFGERPPQIRALDDHAWRDIKTVVVGEESSGKGRWRTAFSPAQELIEQDLPSEVAARKGGWYFLRFYETNDELIESLDFRFICSLKEIKMFQPSPLPSEDGHGLVCVMFLHEPGCFVQSADGFTSIQIERQISKTIMTIPPKPACDETRWLVGPGGGPQVEVTILVERLWWGIGQENNPPSEWRDELLTLARDDFTPISKKALWLRLPRRRWTDRVLAGFERSRARHYAVKVTEKEIAIPLREFGDCREIREHDREHLLNIWIERDKELVEGIITLIPAELPVTIGQESPMPRLNLTMISAPRLASVLAGLRKVTRGPLCVLIKEVHHGHLKGHATRRAESVEFVKKALCVIDFSLELNREEQSQVLGIKKRWIVRARRARDEFPEVMSQLRNRYEELKTVRGH